MARARSVRACRIGRVGGWVDAGRPARAARPGRSSCSRPGAAVRRLVRAATRWRSSPSGCSWSPTAVERARVAGAARPSLRAARRRVSLRAAGLAARHAGARVGARADAAVRRLRADVDPALLADRLPQARGRGAAKAALKFFLVGTVSSAVLAYGLSFIFGVTGTTDARRRSPRRSRAGHPLMLLGHGAGAGRARLQDRRVPVPHVGARHLRGGGHAVRGVARRSRRRPRASSSIFRLYLEGVGAAGARLGAGRSPRWRGADDRRRQPDGDPAAERQAPARLLRHRAHRLHADRRRRDVGRRRRRWCSSIWSPTSSGTWARSSSSRRWRGRRARTRSTPTAAWRSARRCSRWHAALPAVARRHPVRRRLLGQAVHLLGRDRARTCTGWCSSAPS